MITFTPFQPGHLRYVTPQKAQRSEHAALLASDTPDILGQHFALTGWDGVHCVGCAGLVRVYPHKALAWALLSKKAGKHMLHIARKVRHVIDASPYKRVELNVVADHRAGHRFAQLIGAQRDSGVLRAHGAYGGDEVMYSIVKG